MFGFSSWKDRVVRSSVGGGWGRGGAGDDQVRGKLNRRLGGDASEPMCVPLEGSWPSCARPGRVPRTEQRALLCESVVPHPLLGLPASSPHCQEPGASTWRCSREAGILQASAREGSLLMAGLRCSRTSTWAERSAGPRTRRTLRLDFPPALQCSLHPPDPWVESGRSSGIPAAKAPWMSLPATHPSGPDQILCSP